MISYFVYDTAGNRLWSGYKLLHRIDGPALEAMSGSEYWYINGMLHREGGPATIVKDGDTGWWYKNIKYSEKNYHALFQNKS